MQRASLIPITHSDFERPEVKWWWAWTAWIPPVSRIPAFAWGVAIRLPRWAFQLGRWFLRLLATDFKTSGERRRVMPARKVIAGIALHALWLPLGLVLVAGWLVWRGTHPPIVGQGEMSRVAGVFCERVELRASDGALLSALWVPALTPTDILTSGNDVLHERRPAAVLVHDHGQDARQLLPAARALHEAGIHVLILDARGAGHSAPASQTFGQREALDVAAAVAHVRSRPTVDAERVAGWGIGYGATALLNATMDPPLTIVVTEQLPDAQVDTRFVPDGGIFDSARPVCRWIFALTCTRELPASQGSKPVHRVDATNVGDAVNAVIGTFDTTFDATELSDIR